MTLISKIKSLRHQAYLAYCRTLPIQQNKVILWSDNCNQPSRLISRLERNIRCDKTEIVSPLPQ